MVIQRNRRKFADEWEAASPLHRIRRNTQAAAATLAPSSSTSSDGTASKPRVLAPLPPMMVVHGSHDTLIPVEDSRYVVIH